VRGLPVDTAKSVDVPRETLYEVTLDQLNHKEQLATSGMLALPEANHVVFVELGFSPGQVLQGEDRAHRLGQKRDVTVTYVLLENSMDDVVLQMIDKKLRVAHGCLDAAAVAASAVESEQLHPSRKRKRYTQQPQTQLSFIEDGE
jgi:hypothetical protein